jgi:hypothetical protein
MTTTPTLSQKILALPLPKAEIAGERALLPWECEVFARGALSMRKAAADLAAAAEKQPFAASYVQHVPDRCDRIIWRGAYYHLKEGEQPAGEKQAAVPEGWKPKLERKAPPDWDYEKQGGYLIGYADCTCVLSHYCDGKCRPFYEYCLPTAAPTGETPEAGEQAITYPAQECTAEVVLDKAVQAAASATDAPIKAGDKVICTDVTGYNMSHLTLGASYEVEEVSGADVKLVGVEYWSKVWRFYRVTPPEAPATPAQATPEGGQDLPPLPWVKDGLSDYGNWYRETESMGAAFRAYARAAITKKGGA